MPVSGRPFLQIPGPTNVPERILRAMDRAVLDHRSPEFAALVKEIIPRLKTVWDTRDGAALVWPASGTGGGEASLVNVLAPGDRVLVFNYGMFSQAIGNVARHLGYTVDEVPLRWGQAIPTDDLRARLDEDRGRPDRYKAVLVVDNETSTGVKSDLPAVRGAMDAADHDALLIVDAVSSFASMPLKFDEWRVDVAFAGSQKGLMLPPGMGLVCASPRALAISQTGGSPRHFWDWRPILQENRSGLFAFTPATLMLYGLREALAMLVDEEGLPNVYARHARLAGASRAAVRAWDLDILCESPAHYSNTLTAVVVPDGVDADQVIRSAREWYGLSLGSGLGQVKGRVFRLGHLGSLNELEVLAMLGGTEMTLRELGVPVEPGAGVAAAQRAFAKEPAAVNGAVAVG